MKLYPGTTIQKFLVLRLCNGEQVIEDLGVACEMALVNLESCFPGDEDDIPV